MDKWINNWLHTWGCPQGFVLFKKEISHSVLLDNISGHGSFEMQSIFLNTLHGKWSYKQQVYREGKREERDREREREIDKLKLKLKQKQSN